MARSCGRLVASSGKSKSLPFARRRSAAFLDGTGPLTSAWRCRHNALRGFYRWAQSRGHVTAVPLPALLPQPPPVLVPYLFSQEQLSRLLAATDTYQRTRSCMEPVTVRTLLVQTWLHGPDTPFFTTRAGATLSVATVDALFRRLCAHAGVTRSDGGRYQPRLHDLRHTFAVHRLLSWYRQGLDVQNLLPHLSVYLGHVSIAGTKVYLSMTPELLSEASTRFERYAQKDADHD